MPENDGFYIRRCLDGHPDDYRHLVRRYERPLLAYLAGQLGDREAAEEAVQEVFVRCYFGLSNLRDENSLFSWMLGTAGNIAKEQFRQKGRDQRLKDALIERDAGRKEQNDWPLAKTIAKLDDPHRELILLRYYGGLSCKDVAEMKNIPIGTVTKTLSRAYEQLRKLLAIEARESEATI